MKKALILLLLTACIATSYSQESKADYLKKSKNQKTAAWVLLGGGLAMGVGGAVWAGSNFNSTGPDVLFALSATTISAGITLFTISGRNKRKAASMSFIMQGTKSIITAGIIQKKVPSLQLLILL